MLREGARGRHNRPGRYSARGEGHEAAARAPDADSGVMLSQLTQSLLHAYPVVGRRENVNPGFVAASSACSNDYPTLHDV